MGLGRLGLRIAGHLSAQGALVSLCDVDAERLFSAAARFEGVRASLDYLDLLSSGSVRGVVLCTPPQTWDGMCEAAFGAGRDVFLPGPLSLSPERLAALDARRRAHGAILSASPFFRFEPAVQDAASALRADDFGRAQGIEIVWHEPDAPDVGFLLTSALGLLQAFRPTPPRSTHALSMGGRAASTPDELHAFLDADGGARTHIHVHIRAPSSAHSIIVTGNSPPLAPRLPIEPTDAALASALDAFIDAVETRRPTLGGFEDQLAWARVRRSLERSLDTGAPVSSGTPPPKPREWPADVFIHPTADVDPEAEIGAGTRIWHFSKLLGPCTVGRRCSLGQNVVIERNVTLGDNVKVQNNVSIYSGVILEDDVFCGPSMVFTNVGTPRSHFPRRNEYAATRVRQGASIGANATVVCGNTLGRFCFVGAGAVVTRDVPDYALVYGNPARVRGFACWCGTRLPLRVDAEVEEATCPDCQRRYERDGERVVELTS
ncbi:MAG: hypothetical protein EXR76_03275 [Myxococcales bacterium]|nr:hypothetical protein [Myxococcales bacterium]